MMGLQKVGPKKFIIIKGIIDFFNSQPFLDNKVEWTRLRIALATENIDAALALKKLVKTLTVKTIIPSPCYGEKILAHEYT